MGDEQNAGIVLVLKIADQFEDLCLCCNIECGGRLICNNQARFQDQCHGNHDTLALAAGNLMRIGVISRIWIGNLHFGQHIENGCVTFLALKLGVQAQYFVDLPTHGLLWIECGHRLLKNHSDAIAAQLLHFGFTERVKIAAFEPDGAIGDTNMRLGQKAHDRTGR